MNDKDKQRIKKRIETEFSIQNLDDMANMFFRIAESLGHPLKNIDLELTKSWGEQFKDNTENLKTKKSSNNDFKAHKSSPKLCQECNEPRTVKEIDCGDLDGLCYKCYSKYLDTTS